MPVTLSPRSSLPGMYLRLFSIWLGLAGYRWVLPLLLVLAWYLRAFNPRYSSAFMDESIYVVYGRMFLARHFEAPIDQPLHFSFGWYLWPILAAAADWVGGIVGLRELSAVLGTVTVWSVYGFARRLFSRGVGLASAVVFAFLGPAVFAFRIATRDAGTICFFALALWLFVRAWQEKEGVTWVAAAGCLFAAFLCKYLVALYFPFLVLFSLRKGWRPALFFAAPLVLFCGAYALFYASDLEAVLLYGAHYASLKAPLEQAWKIYFAQRADFWTLFVLAMLAWVKMPRVSQRTKAALWLGAAVLPVFQSLSRADYDYWKHVNYSLLFLVPLAMLGLLAMIRRAAGPLYPLAGAAAAALLAVSLGWAGDAWRIDRFLFWPNAEPIAAYFEGRLLSENRVLVDDSVFRYYFRPPLAQWQITDPFYFRYGDVSGEAAYARAAHDGLFDYIALDGGIGNDARRMRAAIQPELAGRYLLRLHMPDPVLGQPIEIYERQSPAPPVPAPTGPRIEILSPASGSAVHTEAKATILHGTATGVAPGGYVRVEVFTNHWYLQGGKIYPRWADGGFSTEIYLAGERHQQCNHLVRARLYDERGRVVASVLHFGIARANTDGTPPSCP